ncbi:MAG: metalloregulator ArsR/SmtB family transcription factor [Bdellovibrionales bacterium]
MSTPTLQKMKRSCVDVSNVLRALSHPQRLMIMGHLSQGKKTVSALQKLCGISQSQLSQFLIRMKAEDLISSERIGKFQFYLLKDENMKKLITQIQKIFCSAILMIASLSIMASFYSSPASADNFSKTAPAHLSTLSFQEIWQKIISSNEAVDAAQSQVSSKKEAVKGAKYHWLPNLYIGGSYYQTQSSTQSFMGLLEQRSVVNSDFTPSTLNHPPTTTNWAATLGASIPIYEGGSASSKSQMNEHLLNSKKYELAATKNTLYSQTITTYGALNSYLVQNENLKNYLLELKKNISTYRLGNRSNKIGYLGSLGLKSLLNRTQSTLAENEAKITASYNTLQVLGAPSASDWVPEVATATESLVEKNITRILAESKNSSGEKLISARTLALKEQALAAQAGSKMSKAQYLPNIKLFAEESLFHGDRSEESSYVAGVKLEWNIFDSSLYSKIKESKYESNSAEYYSRAKEKQDIIENQQRIVSGVTIKQNLALMRDNFKLITEQVEISNSLYNSGNITILQMVDILSRKLDLILAVTQYEVMLLQNEAEQLNSSGALIEISQLESTK